MSKVTILYHPSGYQTAYSNATYNASWSNVAYAYDNDPGNYASTTWTTTVDNHSYPATYWIVTDTSPLYYSGDFFTDPVDVKSISKVEMYYYTGCSDNDAGNTAGYMYHQAYVNSTWITGATYGIPDGGSISYTGRYADITSQKTTWTISDVLALRTRFVAIPRYKAYWYDDGKGSAYWVVAGVSSFYVGFLAYQITWEKRVSKSPLFAFNF